MESILYECSDVCNKRETTHACQLKNDAEQFSQVSNKRSSKDANARGSRRKKENVCQMVSGEWGHICDGSNPRIVFVGAFPPRYNHRETAEVQGSNAASVTLVSKTKGSFKKTQKEHKIAKKPPHGKKNTSSSVVVVLWWFLCFTFCPFHHISLCDEQTSHWIR